MDAPTMVPITEVTQDGLDKVEDLFDIPLIEASQAESLVAEAICLAKFKTVNACRKHHWIFLQTAVDLFEPQRA